MAKRRRIGETDNNEVLLMAAVAAGAYFLVLKPLSDNIFGSDAAKNTVADMDSYNPSESPFSIKFAPYLALYNWTNENQQIEFFHNLKNQYDDEILNKESHLYEIAYRSEIIYDAFGIWHNARTENILAIFNLLQYQTDVSEIAGYMWANYGKDLWQWLKNGAVWFFNIRNGLSNDNLAIIVNKVKSLPESPDHE